MRFFCSAAAVSCLAGLALAQPMTVMNIPGTVTSPVYVTAPPGDTGRAFVVLKGGVIRILSLANDTYLTTPFLTISGVNTTGECGLLGLAFHPQYAQNGYFYVYYNRTGTGLAGRVIARYQVTSDSSIADPASAQIIYYFPTTQDAIHNGGWTSFGPDGYLYFAWGEQGMSSNAQTITSNPLGKVLRLDVNGPDGVPGTADDDAFPADPNKNYCIPPDNPFVGVAGDDETWTYGLRNPWRDTFDPATGNLWIADVGSGSWEEVDFIAPGPGGRNMGWPCMEGLNCLGGTACTCNSPSLTPPIYVYSHSFGCAIQGGFVYHGCALPTLRGQYFFGDYCSGRIWTMSYGGSGSPVVVERTREIYGTSASPNIFSFGQDGRGELYLCRTSSLSRIVPRTPDCNGNGLVDGCEIVAGTAPDVNGNGIIDSCENPWPCHGDFDQDGEMTDADIEAFFNALAGVGPWRADFNGDGDVGTDADIESFFRVLAGGPC
jgi:glucose/arabinose dehydrogenase